MTHLGVRQCQEVLSEGLDAANRKALESHLDRCEKCRELMERVMEEGEPDATAPASRLDPSSSDLLDDEARAVLLRAFVRLAPTRAELLRSPIPRIAELAATPPGALELDLLAWIGSTKSLKACAFELGTDEAALEAACQELHLHVAERHAELLASAETAARELCGNSFARFAQRGESALREPDMDAAAQATDLRHAAAGADRVSQYPCQEHAEYSLFVEEVNENGKRTNIRCLGPGEKRRWSFRLWFESADEAKALDARGLGSCERGVLRVAHALSAGRWTELLDLLLPWRFGTERDDADPAFHEVIRTGSVEGWLVGTPTRGRLWLLD